MTENTDLLKRREELKLALSEENTKTLVDVILGGVNRPFQKMIGGNRILSAIVGTLIIFLSTLLIGMVAVILIGKTSILQQITEQLWFWWIIIFFLAATASMTVVNSFIHQISAVFREHIIDIVETLETLTDIEKWVVLICNKRLALFTGVFGGILSGSYLVYFLNTLTGSSMGFGVSILCILFAMQSSLFVGFLLTVLLLTIRIRHYHLALFPSDPSNSQAVNELSRLLNRFLSIFAVYGALLTFIIIITGVTSFSIILPLFFWSIIIFIFGTSQYSLAQIIQRTKWKTLNSIQAQIDKIQKEQPVPDKEARDTLIWLLDYHNRVKATRNSALDIKSSLNLFNSLLLPVLAFALGNLDNITALFR